MGWIRGRLIGRGSFAAVSAATIDASGHIVAVKSAELSKSETLRKEHRILSSLRCPYVISQLGHDITGEDGKVFYNLFLEFAPGGSVLDAIRLHGGKLDEVTIRSYTENILRGLDYLHAHGIVHCDIKCNNILLSAEGPKISDFGCAKIVVGIDRKERMSVSGTPAYMAPETARGEEQSFPSDVWSLGCTVIAMATGKPPWGEFSEPVSALYEIGFSDKVPEVPSFMSKEGRDFLRKCLRRDPRKRWSARMLLSHSFLLRGRDADIDVISPVSTLDPSMWIALPEAAMEKSYSRSLEDGNGRMGGGNRRLQVQLEETWLTVRGIQEDNTKEETFACDSDWHNVC